MPKNKKKDDSSILEKRDECIEKLKKCESDRDKFLRAIADNENDKKMLEKMSVRVSKSRFLNLFNDLIPVMDTFDTALKSDKLSKVEKDGMIRIYNQFNSIFDSNGVKKISPIPMKEKFDPSIHDAIGSVHTKNVKEDGDIKEVINNGYTYEDEVIRPSRVIILMFNNEK